MNDQESFAQLLRRKMNQPDFIERVTDTLAANASPSISSSLTPESLIPFFSSFKWNSNTSSTKKAKAKQVYKVTPKPSPPLVLSPTEAQAFNQLTELGAELPNPFSKKQLHRAKRQLALRYHPDMGGSQALFIDMQNWIGCLEKRAL